MTIANTGFSAPDPCAGRESEMRYDTRSERAGVIYRHITGDLSLSSPPWPLYTWPHQSA